MSWRCILSSFDLDALPELLPLAPVNRDALIQVLSVYRELFEGVDWDGEYYSCSPPDEDEIYFHHILFHFLDKIEIDIQIAQIVAEIACKSFSRGVFEEYLRRYDGPKLRFLGDRAYIEFLLGFGLLDLETPIRLKPFSRKKILPIERMMICNQRDLVQLLKYSSPPACLERMREADELWGVPDKSNEMWEYYSKV
jgi:hypothetical protein